MSSRTATLVAVAATLGAAAGVGLGLALIDDGPDEVAVAAAVETSSTTTTSTTSTTTTSTTTTTTTTTVPPREATLLFTGDLLPHAPVVRTAARYAEQGWDFTPMFDRVRPIIQAADLAVCHLETPLSPDDTGISGYPVFNAPRALAEAVVDAGFDGCSTASNHSFDRGRDGVIGTLDVLDDLGLGHAGTARTEAEDALPTLYDAAGITIGHVSAAYGLNGFALPADGTFLVDLIDPDEVIAEARAARAAGADFVVVSLHWGTEYRHEPTTRQEAWLEAILPSDEVDLVIGHHAHVVQPVDRVGDEWVVYGVGNFLSNQSVSCCATAAQDGVIVEVDLYEPSEGVIEVDAIRLTPTWVDRSDYTIIPTAAGAADDGLGLADTLVASWQRTVDVMGSRVEVAPDPSPSPAADLTAEAPPARQER
ncbi:MAG: CapA family protein [Acidimicrobiales bacterium]